MLAKANYLLRLRLLAAYLLAVVVGAEECRIVKDLDWNYISPIKIEVRNDTGLWSCALANFVLAVKIDDTSQPQGVYTLGYIYMDKLTDVERSCNQPNDTYFKMGLKFECGQLDFHFHHDEGRYFVDSINGSIMMQGGPSEQFHINQRRMFINSERRHFVYKDTIELPALKVDKDIYQLTLYFWNTELEVFRPSSSDSGDFIQPPDDKSQPFETERQKQDVVSSG